MSELKDQNYEQFLKLFRTNEGRIFRFILTLIPNYSSAEDLMQDTMLVMWRKFSQFEAGTSFAAWGMQIARYHILKFHRKERPGVVHFDSKALVNILEHENGMDHKEDEYLEALGECTEKLQDKSKKLISHRYQDGMKVLDIAMKLGCTVQATYKAISRLHYYLLTCVEQKVALWERQR